ncbi:conserved hypothetical protein [Roseibium sp. TrichSKD4]|nr:conserved hypothetical protein [Roseibium sp. TrichSKD4]
MGRAMAETETGLNDIPLGLAALMERAGSPRKSLPPVEKWNPPYCGELDIRISADGTWSYNGSPIRREPLVRLFASVLRRDEDDRHYLVTPVERIGIFVEDAPFVAVEMDIQGENLSQELTLRSNMGDVFAIGEDNPLWFQVEPETLGLKPYARVRGRLDALFARPLLYQLADVFEEHPDDNQRMGVWSGGKFFDLPQNALSNEDDN